jgi:hypothetical protein
MKRRLIFGVNAAASHRSWSDFQDDQIARTIRLRERSDCENDSAELTLDGVVAVSDHDALVVAGPMSCGKVRIFVDRVSELIQQDPTFQAR